MEIGQEIDIRLTVCCYLKHEFIGDFVLYFPNEKKKFKAILQVTVENLFTKKSSELCVVVEDVQKERERAVQTIIALGWMQEVFVLSRNQEMVKDNI